MPIYVNGVYQFQSTLLRGERQTPQRYVLRTSLFQSTLPRGERPPCLSAMVNQSAVSIHAPTRGATARTPRSGASTTSFNPRSHAGSDSVGKDDTPSPSTVSIHAPTRGATVLFNRAIGTSLFQSTLPRRERPSGILAPPTPSGFNPRSHAGSDDIPVVEHIYPVVVSIHAPARGATHSREMHRT